MSHALDPTRARAYLLGRSSELERDRLEQQYFDSADALAAVEAAEELLIEDYLTNRLAPDERVQFERHYLATPAHRVRVETIRRLSKPLSHGVPGMRWLAMAATLLLVVGGSVWLIVQTQTRAVQNATVSQPAPAPPRVAYTWNVSPVAVRGSSDTPPLVIPTGTDDVRLQLEGEPGAAPVSRGRVVIRTVSGRDIWQEPVSDPAARPSGLITVAVIPASRLRPDDYTITVYERTGADETERARYFLRVRAR